MADRKRIHPRTLRARRRLRPSLLELERRTMLTTLMVTNLQDSGAGSLRYELGRALASDTINFDPSLFSGGAQTITLKSGSLLIDHDLTIQGPGADLLTIDGNWDGNTRGQTIFDVTAHTNTSTGVTISGLDFAHGFSGSGGAIVNSGTLTLNDCIIEDSLGAYGAILNSGTLTLNDVSVANNISRWGGGIYNKASGRLMLNECVVSGNLARNSGGGIYNKGALTIDGSEISDNTAGKRSAGDTELGNFYGGGIYSASGTLSLTGCNVSGNTVFGYGAGIASKSPLTLIDCN